MTDLRPRVYDAIDGYTESQTILKNAELVRPATANATLVRDARNAVHARIREHIVAGTPLPADVADQLIAAEDEQRRLDTIAGAYDDVRRIAADNIEFLKSVPDDAAFAVLASELQTVVAQVHTLLPDLGDARTADEAVARGGTAVTAWAKLQILAGTYDEIRTIQKELIPTGTLNFWPMLLSVGLYRDALTVSEHFLRRQQKTVLLSADASYTAPLNRDPLESEQSWWPADVDRPAALIRIVTNSDPWVPTMSVMEQAWNLGNSATASVDTSTKRGAQLAQERLDAYDKYVAKR